MLIMTPLIQGYVEEPIHDGPSVSERNIKFTFLFYRSTTKIGTLNVRIVRGWGWVMCLRRAICRYLRSKSTISYMMRVVIGKKSQHVTTSAVRNTADSAVGEEGFVYSVRASLSMRGITPPSPHALRVIFQWKPKADSHLSL